MVPDEIMYFLKFHFQITCVRSAGQKVEFDGKEYVIEELTADSFRDVDIALFSAGGSISKNFAPAAVEHGTIVIDNSSAFRMDPTCPLVIPEVNGDEVKQFSIGGG